VEVTWSPIAGADHYIADRTAAQVIGWLAARATHEHPTSTCA
jgi:hypothetical protein